MKFINGQLSLDSSITGTTALFTSGLTVSTGESSGGITLQQNGILIAELRRIGNNNRSGLFLTNNGTVEIQFDTGSFSYIRSNNFGIGTATDAGYKLDVNGTTRIRGAGSTSSTTSLLVQNSAQTSFLTVYDNGAVNIGSTNPGIYTTFGYSGRIGNNIFESPSAIYRYGSGQLTFYGTNNNANAFSFEHSNQQSSTSTGISMINLGGGYQNQQSFQFSNLQIAPTYDFNTNTTSAAIARGIYYNPTITNLRVAQHRAIETVTGDVILGSTSGNVGIGTSTLGTSTELTVGGGQAASSAIARGQLLNTTLTATSNNDVLVGLDVAPTFTNGAFTGVTNLALRVAYSSSRFISFTQRPGYADYGRIQFTNVTGADIYSSSRIDLLPNDTSQSVGLGNNITSQRLASSTNWGLYGPTAPGFLVGANAAFGVLSNNSDGNTDSFVFAGPTGSRHFFKVVQNDVPYFTIVPTGNVLINTTTDLGFKLSVSGSTLLRGSGTTSASYALATQNSSGGTTMVVNNAGNMLIGTTTDAGYRLDVNGTVRTGNLTLAGGSILLGDVGGTRVFNTAGLAIDYGALYPFSITGSGTVTITPAGILTLKGVTHTYSATETYVVQKTTHIGHLQINFDISGSDATAYNYGTISGNVRIYPGEQSNGNGYGSVVLGHNGINQRGSVLIGTITNNNSRLLIGGTVSGATLSTTRATHINATLLATGNTTTLIGLDIQPTFTPGSYTGLTQLALRVSGGTQIIGSGSTGTTLSVFSVDGSSGRLFDVSDDLSSTLFSVNTIAGLPVIEAFANSSVVLGKYGQNTLVVSGTSVGIGTNATNGKLIVKGSGTTSGSTTVLIQNSATTTTLIINDAGNIGIGTSSPQAKLDVNGTMLLGSLSGDPSGSNGMIYYNTTTNKFRGYENGAWENLI